MITSQGIYLLTQFGGSVAIARLLRPAELGIYTVSLSITAIFGILQALGLGAFIIRESSLDEGDLRTVFTVNLMLCVIVSLGIFLVSEPAAQVLHNSSISTVLRILSLAPIVGAFELLPMANLEREGNFKMIGLIIVSRTVVSQGLSVALAASGSGPISLAYGQTAATLFSALMFSVIGRQHVQVRLSLRGWRPIAKFGINVLVAQSASPVLSRVAEFIMARLLGLSALGIYSRATSLNNLVWENLHSVISRVVFVEIAAQQRRGGSLRAIYSQTLDILIAVLWPAFAGLAIVAGPFIRAVYGENWVSAAHPLVFICLSSMALVTIALAWEIFTACGQTAKQAQIEGLRSILGFFLFSAGSAFSPTTAAAGRFAEALISVAIYRRGLGYLTETYPRDVVASCRRGGLLTIAAISPALATMSFFSFSEFTPLVPLAASILLGIILWVLVVITTRHPIAAEINHLRDIVQQKMSQR